MMTSLTIAGLVQSAGWHHGVPVDQWVIELVPYWFLRSISGIMIVTGQFIFAYNTYKTLYTPIVVVAPAAKPKEVKV